MKKLLKLLLLLCFPLVFGTCSKDPETPKPSMGFSEQEPVFKIEDESVSVFFSGNVDYIGTIKEVVLNIGTSWDLSDAENYSSQLVDGTFSFCVPNLIPEQKYKYRYTIDYGVSVNYVVETQSITTPKIPEVITELPTVVIEEITSEGVWGNVTSDGGTQVTERGICWGKEYEPDISGDHIASGEGAGLFLVALPNLDPGVYYVRAYAANREGTAYGQNLMLVAKGSLQ